MSNAEPPRYRFIVLVEGDLDVANAALSNIGQITDVRQVPSLGASADDLTGKTIADVQPTTVAGAYGSEPATQLVFTDGTSHVFVHPSDNE
jgi:hypothetical protein